MAMMFGQSNDVFVATKSEGIALFDAQGKPIKDAITGFFQYWDAGTEVNEEPGNGPNQPMIGGPGVGTAENGNPSGLATSLGSKTGVISSGAFNTPSGGSGPGPLLPGSSYEFTFDAEEGD